MMCLLRYVPNHHFMIKCSLIPMRANNTRKHKQGNTYVKFMEHNDINSSNLAVPEPPSFSR